MENMQQHQIIRLQPFKIQSLTYLLVRGFSDQDSTVIKHRRIVLFSECLIRFSLHYLSYSKMFPETLAM
uniref:Putative ovule protein n=1 Tax=Solanum chacoense TaxID=4108 RepID=A0A0V0GL05_SOLCH